jgi:hypothetical protein
MSITVSPPESPFKLWHLFSIGEGAKKISTFMRGGLWCTELNSIVSFTGDVEGSQPYGIFVSCWHKSEGDPSDRAWQVFGNSGNGVALRAAPTSLLSLAERFNVGGFRARFDQVRYLSEGEPITDAAFQVGASHIQEDEMRVALCLMEVADRDTPARKDQIRTIAPARCRNPQAITMFSSMTFVEDVENDAIILPIRPADFIEEIVIGPKVSNDDKTALLKVLDVSELILKIRTPDTT